MFVRTDITDMTDRSKSIFSSFLCFGVCPSVCGCVCVCGGGYCYLLAVFVVCFTYHLCNLILLEPRNGFRCPHFPTYQLTARKDRLKVELVTMITGQRYIGTPNRFIYRTRLVCISHILNTALDVFISTVLIYSSL